MKASITPWSVTRARTRCTRPAALRSTIELSCGDSRAAASSSSTCSLSLRSQAAVTRSRSGAAAGSSGRWISFTIRWLQAGVCDRRSNRSSAFRFSSSACAEEGKGELVRSIRRAGSGSMAVARQPRQCSPQPLAAIARDGSRPASASAHAQRGTAPRRRRRCSGCPGRGRAATICACFRNVNECIVRRSRRTQRRSARIFVCGPASGCGRRLIADAPGLQHTPSRHVIDSGTQLEIAE